MSNIGMILDAPFPADYRVEKEAISLINAGHQVFLFCIHYDKPYSEDSYKRIQIRRYPSNKLTYKLSALAYTVPWYHQLMKPKIRDFVTRNAVDVIHVHDMVVAEAAFQVAEKETCKVVLDLHENRPAIMREYRHLKRFPGKYLINLETWKRKQIDLVNRADKVIVVTDLARRGLVESTQKSSQDIIVVPNTPVLEFADHPVQPEITKRMEGTFNLLYIGDTSERRGTVEMLKVVQLLKKDIPNIVLWVIGSSSFDSELRRLAHALGVDDCIRFEGWQPESLFASYITGSHICLSPLKRNLHHDTTFANKIFQYMSLGRPLVVSNCPAQAELTEREQCGLVYEADATDEFTNAILRLYNDLPLRTKMGENARRAVTGRWNWEKTSESLVSLYGGFG